MLRREFIKVTSITVGGLIALSHVPSFGNKNDFSQSRELRRRIYHLNGDAGSGCASPPEMTGLLENGISNFPPGWYG